MAGGLNWRGNKSCQDGEGRGTCCHAKNHAGESRGSPRILYYYEILDLQTYLPTFTLGTFIHLLVGKVMCNVLSTAPRRSKHTPRRVRKMIDFGGKIRPFFAPKFDHFLSILGGQNSITLYVDFRGLTWGATALNAIFYCYIDEEIILYIIIKVMVRAT